MKRALLIVLDSVGIGHAPDAADFGDLGADTVGHIREQLPDLSLPTLDGCGLAASQAVSAGSEPPGEIPGGWAFGCLQELSAGKDTTIGHWEIAGVVTRHPLGTFERFPESMVSDLEKRTGHRFIGNYARSGTVILEELGQQHVETGRPILYTSVDSVMQIAAHEEVIPLAELYAICSRARELADEHRIGRVIARPFIGKPGAFQRTANRKDFSLRPPPTILSSLTDHGHDVVSVGKISDIFAGSGISRSHPTKSNAEGMHAIERLWSDPGTSRPHLIFANLVDFDMHFGHRRDVAGYGKALAEFDRWLDGFLPRIQPEDLVILTADHGNDPTWTGSDHTRERVPLLVRGPNLKGNLGCRESFSDIAASLSDWFGLDEWPLGRSFLKTPLPN